MFSQKTLWGGGWTRWRTRIGLTMAWCSPKGATSSAGCYHKSDGNKYNLRKWTEENSPLGLVQRTEEVPFIEITYSVSHFIKIQVFLDDGSFNWRASWSFKELAEKVHWRKKLWTIPLRRSWAGASVSATKSQLWSSRLATRRRRSRRWSRQKSYKIMYFFYWCSGGTDWQAESAVAPQEGVCEWFPFLSICHFSA